jgi:Group II intron, maturase-specific domain
LKTCGVRPTRSSRSTSAPTASTGGCRGHVETDELGEEVEALAGLLGRDRGRRELEAAGDRLRDVAHRDDLLADGVQYRAAGRVLDPEAHEPGGVAAMDGTPGFSPSPRIRDVIADLNPILRGWGNYFRTGNAAEKFSQIDRYVERRLGRLMRQRYGRNLRPGQWLTWTREWYEAHGLYRLRGTVRYPGLAS